MATGIKGRDEQPGGFEYKAAVQVPVSGRVVEGSIEYADLAVKSGQTIRLLAKESGGSPKDGSAFPIVLLTLK